MAEECLDAVLHTVDHCFAEQSSRDENKSPFLVHLTNLPSHDGLDIKHNGVSLNTSLDSSCSEPPQKKLMIKPCDRTAIQPLSSDICDNSLEAGSIVKMIEISPCRTKYPKSHSDVKDNPSLQSSKHIKSLKGNENSELYLEIKSFDSGDKLGKKGGHDRDAVELFNNASSISPKKRKKDSSCKESESAKANKKSFMNLNRSELNSKSDLSNQCNITVKLYSKDENKYPHYHSNNSSSFLQFPNKEEGNTFIEISGTTVINHYSESSENNAKNLVNSSKCPYQNNFKMQQCNNAKDNGSFSETLQNKMSESATSNSVSSDNHDKDSSSSCSYQNSIGLEKNELPHCNFNKSPVAEGSAPPLVMQLSNLPNENGLDSRHNRGSFETSDTYTPTDSCKKGNVCDVLNDGKVSENYLEQELSVSYILQEEGRGDESVLLENSTVDCSNQSSMMEFDILDEFECNDNDEGDLDEDSDISIDELDAMLDAGLNNSKNFENATNDHEYEVRQKVALKARGQDHFDMLPEGWIEVTHNSGMPVYLHKASRVCSVSKPYFLGSGSTRKHRIPVSAIPCLQYLKELEKERNLNYETPEFSGEKKSFPSAKIEVVKDAKESCSLDPVAIREYCQKRFEFQTISVKRFKTWSSRRKHLKLQRQKDRPTLPDNTKLITCAIPPAANRAASVSGRNKKDFIMNPSGKSAVCILHEYVQHVLKVPIQFTFKELENAITPYEAILKINGIEYGSGYGNSKKLAKTEAAKAGLKILIPGIKLFSEKGCHSEEQQDFEFFDQIRIEDPRVVDLSIKAGQPFPFQILLECIERNYGMGDTEIDYSMHNLKHQKNEFLMTVGKHSVSVVCKSKRDGKHRAAQAVLQLLHPHISSWGSLLRMYGRGSRKTLKEKKEVELKITELQNEACANQPNSSILNKLKEEMRNYRENMKNKKPIGKLIPEQMNFPQFNANLKNLEL